MNKIVLFILSLLILSGSIYGAICNVMMIYTRLLHNNISIILLKYLFGIIACGILAVFFGYMCIICIYK